MDRSLASQGKQKRINHFSKCPKKVVVVIVTMTPKVLLMRQDLMLQRDTIQFV